MDKQRGSVLVATMVFIVVLGGMAAALQMVSVSTHRAARQSFDLKKASRTADSALGYYILQLEIDGDYFTTAPPPHAPLPVGDTSFQLMSATPGTGPNEWQLDVTSSSDLLDYRLIAVIVEDQMEIPHGLLLSGTGDPSDDILDMNGASRFASYDPAVGTGVLNDSADIMANGSISLSGTSLVVGDATASGWISSVGPSGITGTETEVAPDFPVEDFGSIAIPIAAGSIASNDNATLGGVFGANWSPIVGPDNYGDLSLTGGSFTLTAGTYRFRNFDLSSGANLLLDTSGGSITIVCAGSCAVSAGATLRIDSGATDNGLMTVLEDGVAFDVDGASSYGQEINDPFAAGYSQLVATGGSGDILCQGGSSVYARLAAPTRDLTIGGSSTWFGSAVTRTANLIGAGPKFFIDESLRGRGIGGTGEYEVEARWRGAIAP